MGADRLLWVILAVIAVGAALLVFNHDSGQTLGLDNDSFASLIWLGAIGTVIGVGVLSRARPGGSLLRQIAIWLAIFLALMVGYRLYMGEPIFPGSQPAVPDSREGVSVFLMDGVDNGNGST